MFGIACLKVTTTYSSANINARGLLESASKIGRNMVVVKVRITNGSIGLGRNLNLVVTGSVCV